MSMSSFVEHKEEEDKSEYILRFIMSHVYLTSLKKMS